MRAHRPATPAGPARASTAGCRAQRAEPGPVGQAGRETTQASDASAGAVGALIHLRGEFGNALQRGVTTRCIVPRGLQSVVALERSVPRSWGAVPVCWQQSVVAWGPSTPVNPPVKGRDLHGSGGRPLIRRCPSQPLYDTLRARCAALSHEDGARSGTERMRRFATNRYGWLTVTESHRHPVREVVREAWRAPCLGPCLASPP